MDAAAKPALALTLEQEVQAQETLAATRGLRRGRPGLLREARPGVRRALTPSTSGLEGLQSERDTAPWKANGPGCRNPGPLRESGRVGGTQDCRTGPDRSFLSLGLPETGEANPNFRQQLHHRSRMADSAAWTHCSTQPQSTRSGSVARQVVVGEAAVLDREDRDRRQPAQPRQRPGSVQPPIRKRLRLAPARRGAVGERQVLPR